MQVTHTTDHVTHAIIGANETMDMGISNSAEFFHILSSTLYTDQIMAVVRETLCNAWDAHIDAGITDVPIEVVLLDGVFAIRDFGKGIPKDKILPIYGVYGASTKKNDGNATGGFGLGCKAPFAYADHFEVTSCHEGIKTIYTMSKSSGRVGGKPAITPILSIPTDETGITVKIAIKPADTGAFTGRIRRILRNGEMLAKFNDKEFELPMKFSECKNGYLIRNEPFLFGEENTTTPHKIAVRYGGVIYPVECIEQIASLYDSACEVLVKIGGRQNYGNVRTSYFLCLLAEPNSISVAPSREALSNQDKTINTLKELLQKFIDQVKYELPEVAWPRIAAMLETVKKSKDVDMLLNQEERYLWGNYSPLTQLKSKEDIADQHSRHTYPKHAAVWNKELKTRIQILEGLGVLDRGLTSVWLKIQERPKLKETYEWRWNRYEKYSRPYAPKANWVKHHLIVPLVMGIKQSEHLLQQNMLIVDNSFRHLDSRDNYTTTVSRAMWESHFHTLPYARKILFLTRTKKDLLSYMRHALRGEGLGDHYRTFVYNYQGKPKQYEEAKALFVKLGFRIFDLSEAQEPVKVAAKAKEAIPTERKPRRSGYASTAAVRINAGNQCNFRYVNSIEEPRIEDPEFYFKMTPSELQNSTLVDGMLTTEFSGKMLPFIKDKGAIATTSVQEQKLRNEGVWHVEQYYVHYLCDAVMTNQNIREYWTINHHRFILDSYRVDRSELRETLDNILKIPSVAKHFGLVDNRTKEEKILCWLWDYIQDNVRLEKKYEVLPKVKQHLQKMPINPRISKLVARVANNRILDSVDLSQLTGRVKTHEKKIHRLLMVLLKG